MRNRFIQIIALLLVPCLVADPVTAAVLYPSTHLPFLSTPADHRALFVQQAMAATGDVYGHDLTRRPTVLVAQGATRRLIEAHSDRPALPSKFLPLLIAGAALGIVWGFSQVFPGAAVAGVVTASLAGSFGLPIGSPDLKAAVFKKWRALLDRGFDVYLRVAGRYTLQAVRHRKSAGGVRWLHAHPIMDETLSNMLPDIRQFPFQYRHLGITVQEEDGYSYIALPASTHRMERRLRRINPRLHLKAVRGFAARHEYLGDFVRGFLPVGQEPAARADDIEHLFNYAYFFTDGMLRVLQEQGQVLLDFYTFADRRIKKYKQVPELAARFQAIKEVVLTLEGVMVSVQLDDGGGHLAFAGLKGQSLESVIRERILPPGFGSRDLGARLRLWINGEIPLGAVHPFLASAKESAVARDVELIYKETTGRKLQREPLTNFRLPPEDLAALDRMVRNIVQNEDVTRAHIARWEQQMLKRLERFSHKAPAHSMKRLRVPREPSDADALQERILDILSFHLTPGPHAWLKVSDIVSELGRPNSPAERARVIAAAERLVSRGRALGFRSAGQAQGSAREYRHLGPVPANLQEPFPIGPLMKRLFPKLKTDPSQRWLEWALAEWQALEGDLSNQAIDDRKFIIVRMLSILTGLGSEFVRNTLNERIWSGTRITGFHRDYWTAALGKGEWPPNKTGFLETARANMQTLGLDVEALRGKPLAPPSVTGMMPGTSYARLFTFVLDLWDRRESIGVEALEAEIHRLDVDSLTFLRMEVLLPAFVSALEGVLLQMPDVLGKTLNEKIYEAYAAWSNFGLSPTENRLVMPSLEDALARGWEGYKRGSLITPHGFLFRVLDTIVHAIAPDREGSIWTPLLEDAFEDARAAAAAGKKWTAENYMRNYSDFIEAEIESLINAHSWVAERLYSGVSANYRYVYRPRNTEDKYPLRALYLSGAVKALLFLETKMPNVIKGRALKSGEADALGSAEVDHNQLQSVLQEAQSITTAFHQEWNGARWSRIIGMASHPENMTVKPLSLSQLQERSAEKRSVKSTEDGRLYVIGPINRVLKIFFSGSVWVHEIHAYPANTTSAERRTMKHRVIPIREGEPVPFVDVPEPEPSAPSYLEGATKDDPSPSVGKKKKEKKKFQAGPSIKGADELLVSQKRNEQDPAALKVLNRLGKMFWVIQRVTSRLASIPLAFLEREDIEKRFLMFQKAAVAERENLQSAPLDLKAKVALEIGLEELQAETFIPTDASLEDLNRQAGDVRRVAEMMLEMLATFSPRVKAPPRQAKASSSSDPKKNRSNKPGPESPHLHGLLIAIGISTGWMPALLVGIAGLSRWVFRSWREERRRQIRKFSPSLMAAA